MTPNIISLRKQKPTEQNIYILPHQIYQPKCFSSMSASLLVTMNCPWFYLNSGLLCSPDCKVSACNAGDPGSIPGSGRSSGDRNGNSLEYSCLENSMGRGAWQATVHGVAKSQTWLSNWHTHYFKFSLSICVLDPVPFPSFSWS